VRFAEAGLVAALLLAGHSLAQAAQTTRVLATFAYYSDTTDLRARPEALRKLMQKVAAFYAEGSGGAHEFVAELRSLPLGLPQPRPQDKCRLPEKNLLSAALRDAGIGLDGYHALVLVMPPAKLRCPGGVQTVFRHFRDDGTSRMVPLAVSWSLTERYVTHEILHTHGLGHANSLRCRGAALAANCKIREYGNSWDLMGFDGGNVHMISAPMRAFIGWTQPVAHGSGPVTYTIAAATRPVANMPTAVRVRLPFSGNESVKVLQPLTLWIEYRAPFGFDSRMSRFENFAAGAMVNLTGSWQYDSGKRVHRIDCPQTAPCLLDMTPETGTFGDAGLAVGRSWTEPFSGTRIEIQSRTEATLTVGVSSP
jgi:hypothetical protein